MPTSVALSVHFEDFVHQQLESGRYNNVSEVVRAGLRLLEDQQKKETVLVDALRVAIAAGLASGPGIPAEKIFARLEAQYQEMAKVGQ